MDVIEQIILKTAEGSVEATSSIGELLEMVAAMHDSVASFKLPEVSSLDNTVVYSSDDLINPNQDKLNG